MPCRSGTGCRAPSRWSTPKLVSASDPTALFFFQAEDGIRDADVTGVQTCALPIYPGRRGSSPVDCGVDGSTEGGVVVRVDLDRSEERRVGKECRSRWSPYH